MTISKKIRTYQTTLTGGRFHKRLRTACHIFEPEVRGRAARVDTSQGRFWILAGDVRDQPVSAPAIFEDIA